MTRYCTKCGATNDESAQYCNTCQTPLAPVSGGYQSAPGSGGYQSAPGSGGYQATNAVCEPRTDDGLESDGWRQEDHRRYLRNLVRADSGFISLSLATPPKGLFRSLLPS